MDSDGRPVLVIFDDCEAVTNAKEAKALASLQQMLLERGRKKKIYVVFISHRPSAGKATRIILVEQNFKLALDLADEVVVINTGRVAYSGSVASVRAQPDLVTQHLGVF